MADSAIKTELITKEGMRFLSVKMGGKEYFLPIKFLGGKNVCFLDISGQVSLIETAADEMVKLLLEKGVDFDTILNPVSKSNALAHAIAVRWTKATGKEISRTIVARKSSTPQKVEASYKSVTTPKEQILSLTDDDVEFAKGKNILVLDDVYGGGGTTKALMELARKAETNVAAHAVVAVEEGSALPEGLFYLFSLPVVD